MTGRTCHEILLSPSAQQGKQGQVRAGLGKHRTFPTAASSAQTHTQKVWAVNFSWETASCMSAILSIQMTAVSKGNLILIWREIKSPEW